MKHHILYFLAAGAAAVVAGRASPLTSESRLIAKAVNILSHESVIQGKETGGFEAARPTEQGWAVSTIMQKSKDPVRTFSALADTGSYYGLLALFALDSVKYQESLSRFRGAEKVIVVTGDQIEEMSAEEFVREFLPRNGKITFERLRFDRIPDLLDTVRGEPRSPK